MEPLKKLNEERWKNCKVWEAKGPAFEKVANRILANKSRYQKIEKSTGVPWWFIGITHYRESNLDFSTNLAQGDPWNKKSTHVPKGRGPFNSFEEAAVDALTRCAPFAARNKDWSIPGALTMFEQYNGLGYYNKGKPSPYVWAGTNQYSHGKYVADGKYDDSAVDRQLGCAGLMKFLGVGKATVSGAAKDTIGPIAGLGTWATLQQYFSQHPYVAIGIAIAVTVGVYALVKWIKK